MTSKHFPYKHLLHIYVYMVIKYKKHIGDKRNNILTSNEALHKFR